MRRWGKTPIHTRSSPAFVVNRCARAFYSEAWRLVAERAADAATIDAVMREAGGFRMGPCELIDLIGQDINFATTTTVREAFFGEPRYRQSPFQKEMIEAGHLGRKTGRGFYDYGPGAARPLPATEPSAPAPRRVFAAGDIGLAQPLVARARLAGLDVEATTETASGPAFVVDGVVVAASDGRPATLRTGVSVVFDLARNYETAARIAIAVADDASPAAVAAAAGFFQALGMSVSRIDDTPGLIVMRTIAMLANEALDAAQQGIASEDDIDMAMMKGVNYPIGPIAWAREIGFGHMLAVIDHLQHLYGEDRYRASMRLRRRAAVEKRGRARN
jgi:3-hydroxybutyryl-CoA dehydrogenase